MFQIENWPPAYIIKKNKRAKNVLIKPTRQFTLEITVPARYSIKYLNDVIDENKNWILKQFSRLKVRDENFLPASIELTGFEKSWSIKYIKSTSRQICYENPAGEIVLMGENKIEICRHLLKKMICRIAKKYLLKELDEVSKRVGLSYESASIRFQKTRWGSCSSDNNISLNAKMIFFPKNLMHHVMIHELAHTIHHHHRDAFWRLVEKHDEHWRENNKLLKKADCYVPPWLD